MFKLHNVYMNEETAGDQLAASEPVEQSSETSGAWYDSFSEEVKGNQNVTKFTSAEELAKSYINAQRLIGAEKIPMPTTDEDWSNTYARLGRPDDPSGYEINAPEGMEVNEQFQQQFAELAHQIGLSQKQAAALAEFDFNRHSTSMEEFTQNQEAATNSAIESLQKEWGNAFEQNVNIASRALKEFASPEDMEFINNATIDGVPVGNHPTIVKLMNNIGKGMMESGKLEGQGNEQVMTPSQIEDKQAQLMAHPAYLDSRHPEHASISRQVKELFELRYPS